MGLTDYQWREAAVLYSVHCTFVCLLSKWPHLFQPLAKVRINDLRDLTIAAFRNASTQEERHRILS
jgi:hypothetical protein